MTERKYKYEYQIQEWSSLDELSSLLNSLVNNGWRVDSHKLTADSSSGWTIFSRITDMNQPLLQRNINVGEVYRILNRVIEPGSDQSREFDAAIKKAVRQELDTY